ncbi:MAG: stage 0 sporulation family protein [Butyrivibrio sp.]|nr:stage 0 sporulation family protein [Butyrivibrio sp.]
MTKVIGVRFRSAGKIYFFSPGKYEIKKGDHVIVETARGVEYGTVVAAPKEVEDSEVIKPLKTVLRTASTKDDEQEKDNREKEREAFKICLEKIRKHNLDMKLIDAEYTFDNNKILFYFTADGRIDFRELVKDLAAIFKTRIELRQIGVRDETKIIGGYGICGRPLCCHSYLSDFVPVSIKMAKEQSLSLNPTKISGVCGRLMCCLKNEEDVYEELNRKMPGVGDFCKAKDGLEGEVSSVNILRQTVKILVDVDDEKEVHEYKLEELETIRKKQKKKNNNNNGKKNSQEDQEMKELEALEKKEKQEGKSKLGDN